tara:strand:- start:2690 stop:2977 length:288 start_codon:yes stop_codon:yes gene_type:complete
MENTSYNHLAGRVNELSIENAKLKENVNAYRDAYLKADRDARKARETIKKLAGQLAAANINLLPKYNQTGPVVGPVAVELHRLPCDNGGIENAKR